MVMSRTFCVRSRPFAAGPAQLASFRKLDRDGMASSFTDLGTS